MSSRRRKPGSLSTSSPAGDSSRWRAWFFAAELDFLRLPCRKNTFIRCRSVVRRGRFSGSDERGDLVGPAEQGLAVDLEVDGRQGDRVPGGHGRVPPDPLQRVDLGEAAGTVRVEQDVDGL